MDFKVTIVGATELAERLRQAPSIAGPILQQSMLASQAILAKNTTKGIVPWRSGFLTQSFRFNFSDNGSGNYLRALWFPTASYAPFVEFGVAPSPGRFVPAIGKRLVDPDRPGFGMWPGIKANDYMGRIIANAQDDIDNQFTLALGQIVAAISSQQ